MPLAAFAVACGLALTGCPEPEPSCPKRPSSCPSPSGSEFTDALQHLARAEGDSFIEIVDLVADGDDIYACTGTQGLTMWQMDGDQPALKVQNVGPSAWAHPSFPRCQHLSFDPQTRRIAVTNRGDEIQKTPFVWIYDVESPSSPVSLSGWAGPKSIEGVVLDGDRLYAAAHKAGLQVFELQEGVLVELGENLDGEPDDWQPLLKGDRVYMAAGTQGLRVYDVEDPTSPSLVTTLALEGSTRDLLDTGADILIATNSAGLVAIDISNPEEPEVLSELKTVGSTLNLRRASEDLVVVAEWDRVRGYDVSDPENMKQVFSQLVPTDDSFSRVLTVAADPEANRVYAGEWTGMHAFSLRDSFSAPDLYASPSSLQFGELQKGESEDRVLILENQGDRPLTVWGIAADPQLSSDASCEVIEPGLKSAIEVRFEAQSHDELKSTIKVCSDDPDDPQYEVSVSANVLGRDIGDPVPEFALRDLEGNDWGNEQLEGNVAVLAYFATF